MAAQTVRKADVPKNFDMIAWRFMRYSSILLIPLVWIHVLIKDVVHGVHMIAETQEGAVFYVMARWADPFWITYDILLLAFAFAHGMNGLRQVALDFIHGETAKRVTSWVIFLLWLVVSALGAFAIIAAAAENLGG